jgi:hypothetical protein
MKTSVLILAKFSSLLLIGALSVILLDLLEDIFFSNYPGDGSMIAAALLVLIPLSNCFFTLHFCNKVITEEILLLSRLKSGIFLALAIINFVFSICVLMAIAYAITDAIDDATATSFYDRSVRDILLLISVIVFSILGPVIFFLQMYVRKAFLLKAKTSSDKLVNSIGGDENNSTQ